MRPEDISECVSVLAKHPVIGPRYGSEIEYLPAAWRRLLENEASATVVIHADEDSRSSLCFFGVTVFVRDDFLRDMKTPPHFWIGPELAKRMVNDQSPVLTGQELREANSRGGLNLVIWEGWVRPGYEASSELQHHMMLTFIQDHRGFLWREAISNQPDSVEQLGFFLKTGAALWDPLAGRYTSKSTEDPAEIVGKPHIIGMTRDLELTERGDWSGSWAGLLFDYHTPLLGFSRSEQRLLSCALRGTTDEYSADMLGTSLRAVKKMWVSIHRRVAGKLPELIPDPPRPEVPSSGRGKERRRLLLGYLREHPQELRPVSRKLLGMPDQMGTVAGVASRRPVPFG
jgi:hypothetical protein